MPILNRLLGLIVLVATTLCGQVPQFRDGDTVVFLGDSITHSRKWHRYVMDYYLTHFPERRIRYINAGSSGDTAAGALKRLERDVLVHHPTVVVTMLGMNDVNRSLYTALEPTDIILAGRRTSLDNYRANMTKLAGQLRAGGVRDLVFIISSPFDDTAKIDTPNQPGVNKALQECGVFLRELAAKVDGTVVDFNTPMVGINIDHQKLDPSFTIVGPDRVHPGEPGMLVMAYAFLDAQNVPRTIGENALPLPVDAGARPALAWIPFDWRFNSQVYQQKGLESGTYDIVIDGQAIAVYRAEDLDAGVNLAPAPTPQRKQAELAMELSEKRRALMVTLRDIARFEDSVGNASDPEVREAWLQKLKARSESQYSYYNGLAQRYVKMKPAEAETRAAIDRMSDELNRAVQPAPHHYEVRKRERP
jgi:lysophospholipase L1-like esterase